MTKLLSLACCALLLCGALLVAPVSVAAAEDPQQVQLLREKLEKLKELLGKLQQEQALQQPPTELPLQQLLQVGGERPGYAEYAYLLAPQQKGEVLAGVLQQLQFFAGRDSLQERGTLFVAPARPLLAEESFGADSYNRELAARLLAELQVPAATESLLVVAPRPLSAKEVADGPLLLIDLAGSDQLLRARLFEQLQATRLFVADGGLGEFVWNLLRQARGEGFSIRLAGERLHLSPQGD